MRIQHLSFALLVLALIPSTAKAEEVYRDNNVRFPALYRGI